jgi:hypothetical protein
LIAGIVALFALFGLVHFLIVNVPPLTGFGWYW